LLYDFGVQELLLKAAIGLLHSKKIDTFALGGGTALSAYFFQHRFSTDIDIFLQPDGSKDRLKILRRDWNDSVKELFNKVGYKGECCAPGHYLEFTIDKKSKIQFFDNNTYTSNPSMKGEIWGCEINIETPDEIIAKKIFHRSDKGNARDIFDIAIVLHSNSFVFSNILKYGRVGYDKFAILFNTLSEMCADQEKMKDYQRDIKEMDPDVKYADFAIAAPVYLKNYIETLLYLRETSLDEDDLSSIEAFCYDEYVRSQILYDVIPLAQDEELFSDLDSNAGSIGVIKKG
jgi:predicted nucleotidyltransferase component of viral defense system